MYWILGIVAWLIIGFMYDDLVSKPNKEKYYGWMLVGNLIVVTLFAVIWPCTFIAKVLARISR